MFKLGLYLFGALILWCVIWPSADSKAHPTAFLEHSAIGRSVQAEWAGLTGVSAEFDKVNGVR